MLTGSHCSAGEPSLPPSGREGLLLPSVVFCLPPSSGCHNSAGETAQRGESLWSKQENFHVISSSHVTMSRVVACMCDVSAEKVETGGCLGLKG